MTDPEMPIRRWHEDADFFRSALEFTAHVTTFPPGLLEKDYFCSLLLEHFATVADQLVFRGGTCLAKVYTEFYRLSEDLDFVIPMPVDAPRSQRSKSAVSFRKSIAELPERLHFFNVVQPVRGANNSTQYIAVVGYMSMVSERVETIKIEVGLREPLLFAPSAGSAQTILIHPDSNLALIPPLTVRCISRTEAFAEKFRAALSRREVTVRDFFDIDYAVRKLGLRPQSKELIGLVRQKLAVQGNEPVDVSERRLAELRPQVESQLLPVLRKQDFTEFNVDRAFRIVAAMAARVI
jgi:predicted nucleotidyltransferase component of viral defense system